MGSPTYEFQFEKLSGTVLSSLFSDKGRKVWCGKAEKSEELKALLTYCFTDLLNLAVGDAIKASKLMKNSLETMFKMTKLIKKKRDGTLKDVKAAIKQEEVGW